MCRIIFLVILVFNSIVLAQDSQLKAGLILTKAKSNAVGTGFNEQNLYIEATSKCYSSRKR